MFWRAPELQLRRGFLFGGLLHADSHVERPFNRFCGRRDTIAGVESWFFSLPFTSYLSKKAVVFLATAPRQCETDCELETNDETEQLMLQGRTACIKIPTLFAQTASYSYKNQKQWVRNMLACNIGQQEHKAC